MSARAFRQQIKVFVDTELSQAARSARFAEIAARGTALLVAEGRASPIYREYVDGTEGGNPRAARRTILDDFAYIGDATAFALDYLVGRSPYRTGAFRDSFVVAVDGRAIPGLDFDATKAQGADEIYIFNVKPQSRRIDVQLDGNRVLHFSVPAGMFDDARAAVLARYGNSVRASRVYTVNFGGQYVLKRGPNAGNLVQSPALLLTPPR